VTVSSFPNLLSIVVFQSAELCGHEQVILKEWFLELSVALHQQRYRMSVNVHGASRIHSGELRTVP
jgi:hypothetical protein